MDINSDQDLYKFVQSIISLTRNLGDNLTAQELSDSLVAFPTSERFGQIMDALKALNKRLAINRFSYPDSLQKDVSVAIKVIEKAFRRANHP